MKWAPTDSLSELGRHLFTLTGRLLESRWTSHANGAFFDVRKRAATGGSRRWQEEIMEATTENETLHFGNWSTGDWSIEQRLSAPAAFFPVLTAPAFQAGEWTGAEHHDDIIVMGSFELGPAAERFVQTAYDSGWVMDFDWPEWNRTEEAQALYHDPDALAQASVTQLAKLLTARIRIDRFCDSALAADFRSGLMTRVAARAAALLMMILNSPMSRRPS